MLVSNGHLLTDWYLSRIGDLVDAIKISIDSPDEKTQRLKESETILPP
jgi:MoaA/NifB/PqqE/SkfB family radical SAM enzyme